MITVDQLTLTVIGIVYIAMVTIFALAANNCIGLKHYGRGGQPSAIGAKLVVFGVMHYRSDFDWRQHTEEREEYFLCIRLPVYGMRYQINYDDFRWSQDILYLGSRRGRWMFSRELPPTAHEMNR